MPGELLNEHERICQIEVPHILERPVEREGQTHVQSSVLSPFLVATSVLHWLNSAGSISSTSSTEIA